MWEGGVRGTAFIAGAAVPEHLKAGVVHRRHCQPCIDARAEHDQRQADACCGLAADSGAYRQCLHLQCLSHMHGIYFNANLIFQLQINGVNQFYSVLRNHNPARNEVLLQLDPPVCN